MHFFSLEFADGNARKDLRPYLASLETEIQTRVEAVEQGQRGDSSKSIQVSVLIRNAPTSSIQFDDGTPIVVPQARRSSRMNSEFGSGFGEQMFTTPAKSRLSIKNRMA